MSSLAVSQSDTQTVHSSLFSNGAPLPLYPFTPQQIHIWTSPKPTARMTQKGRTLMDKNLNNDTTAPNQVVLTCCNVSRRHRWAVLEEAMGNTANFQGGTLYALRRVDYPWSFGEKKTVKGKKRGWGLVFNFLSRPHVSNNYKVWAQRWNDAQNCSWSN